MNNSNGSAGLPTRHNEVRLLIFSASLRAASYNSQLARLAAHTIERHGGAVDLAMMEEFECPSYDQDVQDAASFPPGAEAFRRRLEASDAFVIASPEYNASIPGTLKNAIDWASRYTPQPFNARHGMLLSASPSLVGGNRGLWALRVPLEHLGARIFPDMFSLAQAHQAFDVRGKLVNRQLSARLDSTLGAFMELVEAARYYPIAKPAWIEFLGEYPNAMIERV